jgi:hypothetical protein
VTRPGLLRKAKQRVRATIQRQGCLYPDPVVQRASDLLAEVWAAGEELGITEEDWDGVVVSLPAACLYVAQRALYRPIKE